MAYGTVDQVQAVLPSDVSIDTSTTLRPNRAEVSIWCTRATARVDVALRQGGKDAPLTNADDIAAATAITVYYVAYQVLVVRVGVSDNKNAEWLQWKKDFEEMLKAMVAGTWTSTYTDASKPWSATMDAVTEPTEAGLAPLVTKEKDL